MIFHIFVMLYLNSEMLLIIFKLLFARLYSSILPQLLVPAATHMKVYESPPRPILFPSGNLALDCFNHLDIKGSEEITIMAANRS